MHNLAKVKCGILISLASLCLLACQAGDGEQLGMGTLEVGIMAESGLVEAVEPGDTLPLARGFAGGYMLDSGSMKAFDQRVR